MLNFGIICDPWAFAVVLTKLAIACLVMHENLFLGYGKRKKGLYSPFALFVRHIKEEWGIK